MAKKKKRKRRLKIKNIIIFLIIMVLIINFIYMFFSSSIRNIYIIGNNIVSDDEIMSLADISDYPSFILTTDYSIKNKIKNNNYIKSVKIKRKWYNKLYIYIDEYRPLCIDTTDNKVILDNGKKVNNDYSITEIPLLLNDINEVYANFIKKFSLVDKDILLQISEIKYDPVSVDKERFYLSMNDGNYVYVTLTKIKRLNKYGEIKEKMNNKKGIIYLDSGNYIEIKN